MKKIIIGVISICLLVIPSFIIVKNIQDKPYEVEEKFIDAGYSFDGDLYQKSLYDVEGYEALHYIITDPYQYNNLAITVYTYEKDGWFTRLMWGDNSEVSEIDYIYGDEDVGDGVKCSVENGENFQEKCPDVYALFEHNNNLENLQRFYEEEKKIFD